MAKITIIATGGTRAPTQIELMKRFVADGHQVRLIASRNARRFLTSHMMRRPWKIPGYLRRYRPAMMETFAYYKERYKSVPHISEGKWADIIVMCPATCNSVGKLVAGLTDNYPLQVIRAVPRGKQVIVVPSMNPEMWYDPPFQRNVDLLNSTDKYRVLCPTRGMMLSGDYGFGAQVPFEDIIQETYRCLGMVDQSVESLLASGSYQVPWAKDDEGDATEEHEVVLVDEDRETRDELARALQRQYKNLRVHQFGDLSKAMAWIEDNPPSLVFTELKFAGGATGQDLIEKCRRPGQPEMHLIASSSEDRGKIGAESLARQEVLFLAKPLNVAFAVGMITGCLGTTPKRSMMRSRELAAGDVLFRQGDRSTEVYVVRSGKLAIVKEVDGNSVQIATVGARGMVGEMALLGQEGRAATVEAIEPSEVIELELDNVKAYLDRQPIWLRAMIESLVSHLRATGEQAASKALEESDSTVSN